MNSCKIALLSVIILVISACQPRYLSAPLPLPPKPDMPVYTDKDLSCLPDYAYRWVAERDLAQRYYQQRLEAVIRSTWKQ